MIMGGEKEALLTSSWKERERVARMSPREKWAA
jgi:hypothetical protein